MATLNSVWIYFLNVEDKLIKIGKADKLEDRMRQHSAANLEGRRTQISTLCAVRAESPAAETQVHNYFRELRTSHSAEVFHPGPALIDYLRWLRDQHFVWVPEDGDEAQELSPTVESSWWLPNPERMSKARAGMLPLYPPWELGPRDRTPDDFYSPPLFVQAAREAMGGIDLDPASHAVANKMVCAQHIYTVSNDGLTHPWTGRVWCNPPFGQWDKWVTKILAEWESGRIDRLCVLFATRTSTAKYFSPLLQASDALFLARGRHHFWGENAGSPDDGHGILFFGSSRDAFRCAFKDIGTVFFSAHSETL